MLRVFEPSHRSLLRSFPKSTEIYMTLVLNFVLLQFEYHGLLYNIQYHYASILASQRSYHYLRDLISRWISASSPLTLNLSLPTPPPLSLSLSLSLSRCLSLCNNTYYHCLITDESTSVFAYQDDVTVTTCASFNPSSQLKELWNDLKEDGQLNTTKGGNTSLDWA